MIGKNPGRRIHLVDIEQRTQSQDPITGAVTDTWSIFKASVLAAIEPLSVRDFMQSRSEQSEITVRIEIGYISGIDRTMRLVGKCGCHSGKIYNPAGILEDPDTGTEYITLPCSQGVNQG